MKCPSPTTIKILAALAGGMAPTAPAPSKRLTARQKARARLADPLLPRKLHREDNVVSDTFIDSKRDKRLIKHSSFISRVAKSSSAKGSSTTQKKRRRPSKKLVTTLESLGDALDDIQAEIRDEDEVVDADAMDAEQARQGKVRHKSLKSRPGALKRKERLVKGEMERFGRSLAQLANISTATAAAAAGTTATATAAKGAGAGQEKMDTEVPGGQGGAHTTAQSAATSGRWAALRGFISATMEQNPAFLGKT
ncbi:ribosome biogenesis protein SLX9-domain-containing protein [Parachaetomium inaequale]|uniref:Ribosome biogenesis protein SLX9 n=1 Tax=Parachaetomium inaequale TaxID=2588326 RepID=A0AAN6PNP1_9PEZI|nr:ribosome biogenesis protein SLX9-domain-containing protein [Parachaetomium inaequale]